MTVCLCVCVCVSLAGRNRRVSSKHAMFKAVLKKNRDGGKGSKKEPGTSERETRCEDTAVDSFWAGTGAQATNEEPGATAIGILFRHDAPDLIKHSVSVSRSLAYLFRENETLI